MAGGEEKGRAGSLGEPLPPSDEPQGFPEEQPQLGREDEQEEESERSEDHLKGVLDADTAAEGLHTFGYSAPGTEYVYLHLSLPGRELSDISILSGYIHLQKLDLSCNQVNDLSCISHMPYLIELNASRNQLTTCFHFKAPKNLKEVDFSHNQIQKMEDLSEYHALTTLLLDYNEIGEIRGLEKCHSLSQLGLSHNKLTAIQGLENLPIRILNLSFNQIEKVNGLKKLKNLHQVDLSYNKINSLQGLEEHDLLEEINLENNQVAELRQLIWIEDLPLLRVLNLLKNPLQEQDDYWLSAIFMLLQVRELDLKKVSVEEKVAAVNEQDPPPEVVASADHRLQVLYHVPHPQTVLHSTLPGPDEHYPMLVLLGPLAAGKRQLALKICKKFKKSFRFGPCHTTRKAYFGEENRLDYYFISPEEFHKMMEAGEFLVTYKYSGHKYGLARATVESIAKEGMATCVYLEIEGVRSLKNTHFQPRYILLVPRDKKSYEEHLRRMGLFSRAQVEEAVARVDMYLQINVDSPGYFDATIYTDDLDEAFTELTHLVKIYLGLEPPEFLDSFLSTASEAGSRSDMFPEEEPPPDDFLDTSGKSYPQELPDVLRAPSGPMEEASLQRHFSAAHQTLFFQRNLKAEFLRSSEHFPQAIQPRSKVVWHNFKVPKQSPPQKIRPIVPPVEPLCNSCLSCAAAPPTPPAKLHVPAETPGSPHVGRHLSRHHGYVRDIFVTSDPAFAKVIRMKFAASQRRGLGEAKREHQEPGGAGKGVGTSKETEVAGENFLRKSSRALGFSPVPGENLQRKSSKALGPSPGPGENLLRESSKALGSSPGPGENFQRKSSKALGPSPGPGENFQRKSSKALGASLVPGENLQRKSSKVLGSSPKLGSSPGPQLQSQPGSHSRPVLPPILPGWKSTKP